jgi:ABC-type bacteriocin/lantibiotic exporter with double-glycine peptidase domain
MDDKKIFELKALELAYNKQLLYMFTMIVIGLIGVVIYIINIYRYNMQLLLVSLMLMSVSAIILFGIDTKMKELSKKIKKL